MDNKQRIGLGAGAAAGPAFIGSFTLQGAFRKGYDWQKHPVSSLSLGPGGWVQKTNFLAAGALFAAYAAGLARSKDIPRAHTWLMGGTAAGLIAAGICNGQPGGGFPAGTPDLPEEMTGTGMVHNVGASSAFLLVPVSALIHAVTDVRSGRRGWALYDVASALGTVASVVAAGAAIGRQDNPKARGGLLQRAAITAGMGWISVTALRRLRPVEPRA
ncbi:hypothetical protein JOF48_000420 [Arthrobacter stackebrandtii]|uniref:DUF998 domain-containing protein n=1 Tax=Arthrobacter stackebrandtii TaxID=272161 RepID=A0ABS4YS58_9MICC|nr:DUF998 domain-containing protein [Arthrobacter stackebrandtii]MBP2411621.1 hypothetical protein [Arthrobacter stackebrandtii]PYG99291.1 DUF998 domain-containing protein [Arthrobacter stackebrandtii]